MRILEFAQGTPEWSDARLGLITASQMKRIMTPATQKFSTQAIEYACELIAEKLTGGRDPWKWEGETADMQRGTFTENEARKFWQLERDMDVRQVGLCIHENERWAASPDGLVGDDGGIELKCPAPKTQVRWLYNGGVPKEHLPQVHGALIVTGREWWDFLSYSLGLSPILVRVTPNEYTDALRGHLEHFNKLYDEMLQTILAEREKAIEEAIERRGGIDDPTLRSFIPADVA